jgi:CheY-like chemotaxis protein/DNA-directed RNA polymerase specialized sigma24 family protein
MIVSADAASSASSLADRIAPHLPYLRRYARALTGSQTSGDTYVAAVLETLIADRTLLVSFDDARVGVYAIFQRLWRSAGPEAPEEPIDALSLDERAARARLSRLSPTSQQALLLTAVEGFDVEQAARILGLDPVEAAAAVNDGVAELKSGTRARVMVIEDEPIIALDLEAIVGELGHEVVGVADTRDAAVALALAEKPDLVLADVQLADGSSGIDAVRDILAAFDAPIIFITAFPERLLTGARPEPTFLISKPFEVETVQAAISQALFFRPPG